MGRGYGKEGEHGRGGRGKDGKGGHPPIFYCTPSSSFIEMCLAGTHIEVGRG